MNNKLTMLLPTRNRPEYLKRLFKYLDTQEVFFKIIIVDSSEEKFINQVDGVVSKFSLSLPLELHRYNPNISVIEKVSRGLDLIQTPYSVITADDDFHIPSTIKKSIEFLEKNQDYSAVQGTALFFKLRSKYFGKVESVYPYYNGTFRSVEDSLSLERLKNYIKNPSTTWLAVQRTRDIQQNYKYAMELDLGIISFGEFFPVAMTYIKGKVKCLDDLFVVREADAEKHYDMYESPFEMYADMNWLDKYVAVRNKLAEEVLQYQDNVSLFDIKNQIQKAYIIDLNVPYVISKILAKESWKEKFINKIRRFSLIKKLWYRYNTKKSGVLDKFKNDFDPIKNIVENIK
jgi:glycosyltransferase domain-containing protein